MALYICLHHDIILRKNSKTWQNECVLDPYFFNSICWIQFCDKKNLTFVDCRDRIILNLSWKNIIKLAKGLPNNIFQDLFNSFSNKPRFLRVCSTSLLKTLWEKEKLLVTNIFSFSHSVFYLFRELSTILIKLKVIECKLFQFGRL